MFFFYSADSKNIFVYCVGSGRFENDLTGLQEVDAFMKKLPNIVLEYILGIVSPYSDLQYSKIFYKRWLHRPRYLMSSLIVVPARKSLNFY